MWSFGSSNIVFIFLEEIERINVAKSLASVYILVETWSQYSSSRKRNLWILLTVYRRDGGRKPIDLVQHVTAVNSVEFLVRICRRAGTNAPLHSLFDLETDLESQLIDCIFDRMHFLSTS